MKIGRNEPCPCGSGLKVKRCCGVDGIRRSQETAEELFGLAFSFPGSRPDCAEFDAWAETAPDRISKEWLAAGGTAMGPIERKRVVTDFVERYPHVWAGLLRDFGNDELAAELVVGGAVVAGVEERQRALDPGVLELLEHEDDAVEVLALALTATDLWNVLEVGDAYEQFQAGGSYGAIADSLWTEWHGERLRVLVARVRDRLPALERAARAFDGDARVRRRLRGELLLDAFPSVADALLHAA